MEVNGGGVPIQWGKADFSGKYAAFLCLMPYRLLGFPEIR